ncbi:Late embryogenesis abundant protein, LEA-14 [Spatholobus suberectus]|nr:Late embryogenesis abundant protein, LEA-14 [Spatholobus suberectus]
MHLHPQTPPTSYNTSLFHSSNLTISFLLCFAGLVGAEETHYLSGTFDTFSVREVQFEAKCRFFDPNIFPSAAQGTNVVDENNNAVIDTQLPNGKPIDPPRQSVEVHMYYVHNFYFGEGSDMAIVPTKMLTVSCSVRMIVHNPVAFFGIHVNSKAVNLMYSEIAVATGEQKKHYQPRKSTWTMSMNLQGSKVPLYGFGASLPDVVDNGKIPMNLVFEVKSQRNVVGKSVKSKHRRHAFCSVAIDSHNNQPTKLKENACSYN